MAGEDNIKLAVRHIEKAIAEKNTDIKRLTTELDRQRKDIEKDIDKYTHDISKNNAIMSNGDITDERRALVARHLTILKSEIEERRKQLTMVHDNIKDQIRGIEQEVNALNAQLQHIHSLR